MTHLPDMLHDNHTAHAGWSTCDITPPLGLPMGGRGARFSPGASVLDPLLAQAFVLRDQAGFTTAWLSVDLIELPDHMLNHLAKKIAGALGTTPDAIFINVSHTHSGPMMGMERYATLKPLTSELAAYFQSLTQSLIKLTIGAAAKLTPVTLRWHMGESDIGINRRKLVNGEVVMAPNPDGEYDRSLWVLDVQPTDDKKQRCVLLSHSCHPVMVYGFAWDAISAEWPGQTRLALQKQLKEQAGQAGQTGQTDQAVHCQFFQGFAGNVRPRILSDESTGTFRKAVWDDVVATGQKLASDTLATLNTPGQVITPKLATRQSHFVAQHDAAKIPPVSHWQERLTSEYEHLRESAAYWLKRSEPGQIPPYPTTSWPIGMIQLTPDHYIVTMGGEPVAQWRQVIEQALPGKQLATWGYTIESVGYLASDDMIPQGGYEVTGYPPLGTHSPAPFTQGLNAAAAKVFQQMAASIEKANIATI